MELAERDRWTTSRADRVAVLINEIIRSSSAAAAALSAVRCVDVAFAINFLTEQRQQTVGPEAITLLTK